MTLYDTYVLPRLVNWVCSQNDISRIRSEIVPLAEGRTLEVGMGSGLNLPFYDPSKVEQVFGIEPLHKLRDMAEKKALEVPFGVDFVGTSGEEIFLESNSVDTVLVTYTLCSIPDVVKALKEMKRVLKFSGKLIFCEHGRSPEDHILKWQNRLNRPWTKISGGCHLNRPISELIKESGFKIKDLETRYNSPLKLVSYNYRGIAVPG